MWACPKRHGSQFWQAYSERIKISFNFLIYDEWLFTILLIAKTLELATSSFKNMPALVLYYNQGTKNSFKNLLYLWKYKYRNA